MFDVAHVKLTPVRSFAEDTQSFFVRRCGGMVNAAAPETECSKLLKLPLTPYVLVRQPQPLEICVQNATNHRRMGAKISDRESGGITMRILIICAIALTAMGLGG